MFIDHKMAPRFSLNPKISSPLNPWDRKSIFCCRCSASCSYLLRRYRQTASCLFVSRGNISNRTHPLQDLLINL